MLEDFKEEQPVVFKILTNVIKNDKCSHAYLFETNGYNKKNELTLAFIKSLFCPNKYIKNINCVNCTICQNIDKNIYPELKIINPDGLWIKKDQLLELQKEFKTKSLNSKRKIYIINNAEKLNESASNSILKFLEEPEEGIIAILLTDNIHQLLDTIVSRCQIISFSKNINNFNKSEKLKSFLDYNENNLEQLIDSSISFINYYEKNKLDSLIYTKKLIFKSFNDKNLISIFFDIIVLYYKDAINLKFNKKTEFFNDKELLDISLNNDINELIQKINLIMNLKQNLKINANLNLLIDKLIIELGG